MTGSDCEKDTGSPRSRPRVLLFLILVAAAAALSFRLPGLSHRPMHTDEAVHAVKFGILLDIGEYQYDPYEYHGPTIYYVSMPFVWLTGARSYAEIPNEIPLRLASVVGGVGLILLLILIADGLGRPAAIGAAVLTAVSPAMVFYSRYYIQEMLLVFFTFAAIVAGWRYSRTKKLWWALMAGASLGLMHGTKETCLIAWIAMAGAGAFTVLWNRIMDGHHFDVRDHIHHWHILGALKIAIVVSVLCLTALLSNPRASLDSVLTYSEYLRRGLDGDSSTHGMAVHNHPWYYYLQLLIYSKYRPGPAWTESFIVILSVLGIGSVLTRRSDIAVGDVADPEHANINLLRFIAFYTIFMTFAYSMISYKTPWCLLGFLHGMIIMAAVAAITLYKHMPNRFLRTCIAILLALGVFHLGVQARRSTTRYSADLRNPYVYGHTTPDFLKLSKRVNELAEVHPDGYDMAVNVIVTNGDYWPVPWNLRKFSQVGYWQTVEDEAMMRNAPVIIASPDLEAELDAKLDVPYLKEYYGFRPEMLLTVYIRTDLWDRYMEGRS